MRFSLMSSPQSVDTLIVGAGITGLATAAALGGGGCQVIESDSEVGGFCKTVRRNGFVWDYSGHFFHFKHPEIEAWLRARMPAQEIRTVQKRSFIAYGDRRIDFPFQKNIHQLPQEEFLECLHDLYFAQTQKAPEHSFQQMLYARFGRALCEKFLVPYNEKLYACDLNTLDPDAMGRFFPHANLADIIRNMRTPDNASYNQTFTYPEGGAIEYVKALASELPSGTISLEERLLEVDLSKREARTSRRVFRYRHLVSTAPLPRLLSLAKVPHDPSVFSWNKVLVFNLGFDKKGPDDVHWIYFPDRQCSFYRVGFYDNIFGAPRMSLYVELGHRATAAVDVAASRKRVLDDLRAQGILTDQTLVAHHSVVMDPAYVHITRGSLSEQARLSDRLAQDGVYSIGRYGRWTYCSIEDNIVEARALAERLKATR
jgi:protoporphyrinogen oxidase